MCTGPWCLHLLIQVHEWHSLKVERVVVYDYSISRFHFILSIFIVVIFWMCCCFRVEHVARCPGYFSGNSSIFHEVEEGRLSFVPYGKGDFKFELCLEEWSRKICTCTSKTDNSYVGGYFCLSSRTRERMILGFHVPISFTSSWVFLVFFFVSFAMTLILPGLLYH